MNQEITSYNQALSTDRQAICELLATEITKTLPQAESKVWHGSPVWFLDGNPVVGYSSRKANIQLLFWSGRSFDEDGLKPEGTFQAAEARYDTVDQVNLDELKRWLNKAERIQWDYKNIVKRKGVLERLK